MLGGFSLRTTAACLAFVLVVVSTFATGLPMPSLPVRTSTLIEGDAQLDGAHGVTRGSGTAEDPFVISGATFVAAPASYALRLAGTRAHVVIEDVVLQSAPLDVLWPANCDLRELTCDALRGIDLVDAQNVTIRNVRTGQQPMTGWGILIREGSRGVLVEDVDLMLFFVVAYPIVGVSAVPIGIDESSDIVVRDATLYGDSAPIWVTDSSELQFEGGSYDGYIYSAMIQRSNGIVVRDVELHRSLALEDSSDARVIGNDFQSTHGVQVYDNDWEAPWLSHSILVCGNRIDARLTGLVSANVRDLRVVGNDFVDPKRAFEVLGGERVEIDRNRIGPTEYYNLVESVAEVDLHHNNFVPGEAGLTVVWSTGTAVDNWWGHASGPAPGGAGILLEIHDLTGVGMPFAPWLDAPPSIAVDCDAIPTPGVG